MERIKNIRLWRLSTSSMEDVSIIGVEELSMLDRLSSREYLFVGTNRLQGGFTLDRDFLMIESQSGFSSTGRINSNSQ